MKRTYLTVFALVILAGCGRRAGQPQGEIGETASLTEARQGFKTKLVRRGDDREPVPDPPPSLFRTVRYDSPVGQLAAYLTPDPKDGKKHPAIIWITGGGTACQQ